MTIEKSIIIAAAIIALSILIVFHFEISQGVDRTLMLDRWTGKVSLCHFDKDANGSIVYSCNYFSGISG
ncbi:MAG: hypothetical protein PHD48_06355 [Alphaproteobacteria bacterium]|nr:hypothetical protein [Alphaproteobacteria bacterium]